MWVPINYQTSQHWLLTGCPQAGEEKVEFLDDHEVGSQVHPRETYPLLDPLWHTEALDLI